MNRPTRNALGAAALLVLLVVLAAYSYSSGYRVGNDLAKTERRD